MIWFKDKKAAKKKQLKLNRMHQEIFQALRLRRAEEERVEDIKEGLKPKRASESRSPEVSDKVARIRNRLDGSRRVYKERWNRFAGTSDAGGRGL